MVIGNYQLPFTNYHFKTMLLDFEKKIADFIRSNDLFGCGENVLLAVSGGADSTALLHTIRNLIDENILSIRL
ncbi:MAG: hypothetical protein MUP16_03790, partial [Sedimentisphaerales bacterium]|nr:hypothetical protein [Sedimentisphaerales bacterium]